MGIISSKTKNKENAVLVLNRAENLMTKDTEKANALSAFFTSAFTVKTFKNVRPPGPVIKSGKRKT